MEKHTFFTAGRMARIGILAAAAALVMLLKFPLPFFPSFYKLDFSETVVLIGAFAMGPVSGVLIEAVKVLLNLAMDGSVTAGLGELANFVMGCSFILPASLIYARRRTFKGALIGMAAGLVALCIVGGLTNAYLLIPAYAKAFNAPVDAIIGMGASINPAINSLPKLVLLATTPFNLLKGGSCLILALLLYKRLSRFLAVAPAKPNPAPPRTED